MRWQANGSHDGNDGRDYDGSGNSDLQFGHRGGHLRRIASCRRHDRSLGHERYRGNRLIFLAPDHAALARVNDCVRTALAWKSIVDDVEASRLNIDLVQKKQAEKELKSAEEVLPKALIRA